MSNKRFFGFLFTTAVTPSWKLKGSPNKSKSTFIWVLPVWGGGGCLDPCQDGLGHLFGGELSKFKWAFAWFWGVKKLARMVWGTFFQRIFTEGLPLNIHLYYSFRNHTTLQNVKIGPENRCHRVLVWVRGRGGSNGYLGNAQMNRDIFMLGLP